MTLPNSGPLSISDLQGEFGGPAAPRNLLDYYRGGAYVPDTAQNASIPTSGAITLPDDFYGTAAQAFNGPTGQASSFNGLNGPANATFIINSDGTTSATTNPSGTENTPDWAIPAFAGVGNDYEVRATVQSGSTPSTGTVNSWLALSSNRSWSNQTNSNELRTTQLLMEIRPAGGGSTLSSGTVTITAESSL